MKFDKIVMIVFILAMCSMQNLVYASASKIGAYSDEPIIRVGLWTGQSNVFISAKQPFVLKNTENQKILSKYDGNTRVFMTQKKEKIFIENKEISANQIEISFQDEVEESQIEVNRKIYRGKILIRNIVGQGLQVVNILPLEQYLYSIVPSEMPASWHFEAVKAQAVAARSFALANMHKHEAEGFDVCATTHCQVYGGKDIEMERSTIAVENTRGLTMFYQGKPITAVFHSSAGGKTEDSENVWGSYSPYLRSVEDYDQGLPNYQWEKKMHAEEIQTKLENNGYSLGDLQAIELSIMNENGKNEIDRTATGRVKTIRFIGDKGNISLDGSRIRSILGLNSTKFDISLVVPNQKEIEVPLGMYYKKNIEVNVPPYKETKGLPTDKKNIRRLTGRLGEIIVFNGFGWGHGLGLSQWGAKAMADKVAETDTTYFKDILKHYYTGIEIKKIY